MSTVTTYLNLVKAAIGEQYSLSTVNNNLDMIDNWVKNFGNKGSKGVIGDATDDGTNTAVTATEEAIDAVSVNLVNGRWYQVVYRLNTVCSAAANIAYVVKCKRSTDPSNTAGVEVDDAFTFYTAPVANSGKTDVAVFNFKAATTETINIKITSNRLGASNYDISLRKLTVTDLGAF